MTVYLSPFEQDLERIVAAIRRAQVDGSSLIKFIRKTVNFASQPANAAFEIGTIPANAIVIGDAIYVSTTPSGTTNTLNIGYASDSLSTADADAYASALALPITTSPGRIPFDELTNTALSAKKRSVDTTLTATRSGTGTTGIIDIVVTYVPTQ